MSPQQVALAWELARSDNVIPIPGASRPESVADSTAAVHLQLDDEDLATLSAVGHADRRRTSQKVSPSRATETSTNQPSSIHWNGQYRLAGW